MAEKAATRRDVIMGGVGGRGVLLAGLLLARAAMPKYKHVMWFPAYAGAMRGGPCECTVALAEEEIASPIVPKAEAVIVLEASQLKDFEPRVKPGGKLILDSSLIPLKATRTDVEVLYIPATQTAVDLGNSQNANMVLLGAYLQATQALPLEDISAELQRRMGARAEAGMVAIRAGAKLVAELSKN